MTHELSRLRGARQGISVDLEAGSTYVRHRRWAGLPPALEGCALVSTCDPRNAERLAAPLLGRIRLTSASDPVASSLISLHATVIGAITLGHLRMAAATVVEVAATMPRLLVVDPVGAGVIVGCGATTFEVTPGSAVVVQPGRPVTIRCPPGCALHIVGLEQAALLVLLGRLVGRTPDEPLVFDAELDLGGVRSARWNTGVSLLHAELAEPGSLLRSGTGQGQLEEFLMTSLLHGHHSTYSALLSGGTRRPEGRATAAAKHFIELHLPDRLAMAEVADAAGVSVRTLQAAFRSELHTTPVAYIRSRRLDRARAELVDAAQVGVTVTDVATGCGITHLGRFAAAYRARFGESPSQTLRRHRSG